MHLKNPFCVHGYTTPAYFCDREEEVKRIDEAIENGRNITLISARRKGKSSLIRHVLHAKKAAVIYSDLFKINSFTTLTERLAADIVEQIGEPQKTFLQKLARILVSFRVGLGFDSISSTPEVTVSLQPQADATKAMGELFQFLAQLGKPVIWAIDEMQQITTFEDGRTEALFREMSQSYPSIRFLYAGSNRSLMTDMFTNPSRPFYQSTELIFLEKIPREKYIPFIAGHLRKGGRKMTEHLIAEGLDWCMGETYFVQRLFNKIYATGEKNITEAALRSVQNRILDEKHTEFQILHSLFSRQQQKLLIALAREGTVDEPTASAFLKKYNLSAASTVSQSLSSLMLKDMVHQEGNSYKVADAFYMHWLKRE